jgi:hypothetical protein
MEGHEDEIKQEMNMMANREHVKCFGRSEMSNVGRKLLGYSLRTYEPKRIEAEGYDWIVLRFEDGRVDFISFNDSDHKMDYIQTFEKEVTIT